MQIAIELKLFNPSSPKTIGYRTKKDCVLPTYVHIPNMQQILHWNYCTKRETLQQETVEFSGAQWDSIPCMRQQVCMLGTSQE